MHAVVSVDGYIADAHDDVGPLFEWYFNGDTDIVEGAQFKVSEVSAGYVRPMWESIGSMVIGRHLFDLTNGWDGHPPSPLVTWVARPWPWAWSTRWQWMSSRLSSGRVSGTSARSAISTCWRIPTWSSRVDGSFTSGTRSVDRARSAAGDPFGP